MFLKPEDLIEYYVSSLPTVYFKVRDALKDEDVNFDDIAAIIGSDPSLSARLLKIVNSAFYGLSSKVETISHALTIVGKDELNLLALATALKEQFDDIPNELLSMESFWSHSIACGVIAREISVFKKEKKPETLYIAGMLHDIGSLVIYGQAPDKAAELLSTCNETGKTLSEVENDLFGFTHADVGDSLFRSWMLPNLIVECTSSHHQPSKAKNYPKEVGIIHVSDYVAHEMGFGSNGEPKAPQLDPEVFAQIDLEEGSLEFIKNSIPNAVGETISLFY